MRYPVMVVSDLHLTSKESDNYRWGLFPWIIDQVKQKGIKELYILGDITDSKDRHPSLLVNKLVGNLARVAMYIPIKIIKGNHDYIDSDNPFMEFINHIPNIEFYSMWTVIDVKVSNKTNKNVLFLPHTRNYSSDWAIIDFNTYDYIFMHQTVGGSKTANGFVLEEGINRNYFGRKVYSGDIHVPQSIGNVEYIGAPYPIRFGDSYKARTLMLDLFTGKEESLYFQTIKKEVIDLNVNDSIEDFELNAGDMVKLRIHLKKSEYYKWELIKKECLSYLKNIGVICAGVEIKELKRVKLKVDGAAKEIIKDKTFNGMLENYAIKEHLGEGTLSVGRSYL